MFLERGPLGTKSEQELQELAKYILSVAMALKNVIRLKSMVLALID
jgi:hypothetical protein